MRFKCTNVLKIRGTCIQDFLAAMVISLLIIIIIIILLLLLFWLMITKIITLFSYYKKTFTCTSLFEYYIYTKRMVG